MNRRKRQVAARMKAKQRRQNEQAQLIISTLEIFPALVAEVQRAVMRFVEGLPAMAAAVQAQVDGLTARRVERLQGGSDPYRRAAWWRL